MSRRRTSRQLEQLPATIAPWLCPSNKRGYGTREDAQVWLRYLQRLRGDNDGPVESRECRCALTSCNGGAVSYHLASDSYRRVEDQREAAS